MKQDTLTRVQTLLKRREKLEQILQNHIENPFDRLEIGHSGRVYLEHNLEEIMPELIPVIIGMVKGQIAEINKELEQL